MSDMYNGIKVGDTVRRTKGRWHGCDVGAINVVKDCHNHHLRFEGNSGGHSPQAHEVIKPASPIGELFDKRAGTLFREGA